MNEKKNKRLDFPSLFVTGNDTEIGKSTAAALLILLYKDMGIDVGFMKPVQSGSHEAGGKLLSQDAAFMSFAAGSDVEKKNNPYVYKEIASPYIAAKAVNEEIDVELILGYYEDLKLTHQAVIVEGAGGLYVPVTKNSTVLDIIGKMNLPVIHVVDIGLGTINHTLLSMEALRARGISILGLIINRFRDDNGIAMETNIVELKRLTGLPVVAVIPEMPEFTMDEKGITLLKSLIKKQDKSRIRKIFKPPKDMTPDLVRDDLKYVWHPFTQMNEYRKEEPHPLVIEKGDGSYLFDSEGDRYLDGVSSLWVNVHGHRNKRLDEALRNQAGKIAHSTMLGLTNEPAIRLAKKLIDIAPEGLAKVFYSDSGSTAVEIALKMSYQYWKELGYEGKNKFVSFRNAYHGDTIGSVSVGGIDLFHKKYEDLLFDGYKVDSPYCYRCPMDLKVSGCTMECTVELENILSTKNDEIAAMIVEPMVQGAAGMLVSPPGYLARVSELANKNGVLLVLDEVATGFGRTGEMFASDHEKVSPDIMCVAKGITGGYLPLAATLASDEIYSAFLGEHEELRTFFHGHTYTGNPLACEVARANIDLIKSEDLIEKTKALSEELGSLLSRFYDIGIVGDIRQSGLMIGIELVKDRESKEIFPIASRIGRRVILEARGRGVIIRPLGDVIVLMPPLTISRHELKELLDITYLSIEKVASEL